MSALDARTKLFFILMMTLLVFLISKLAAAVCLLSCFIFFRFACAVPFRLKERFRTFRNLTLLAAFIIAVQTVFGPGETFFAKPSFFRHLPLFGDMISFKHEGFLLGIVIACRLACLVVILPVFTETTPPGRIAAGLCSLGINYRTSFIITTAFNLMPFFRQEALSIIDAQRLRGMRKAGIRTYISLLPALMLDAMRKAHIASAAMDSRAFGIYKTRTWIDKPRFKKADFLFLAACMAFSAFFLYFNYR
ncbi:MAG: energy-coupling factor transporter transmembrane protein EcfT [Treponema sp.]|nr:energy-coupling factor transporter transmembrane protein EcfT [Treponema sp.]